MADIVLAEHQGRAWLVSGERYIDDLLANTLPADISIEFVACVSHADVNGLWLRNCGAQATSDLPWVIHPGIINRIRRRLAGHSVFFGQWSAMLDDDARSVIRDAAQWALSCGQADVALISYPDSNGSSMLSDLANIRQALIEAELAALGVPGSRMVRAVRDMTDQPGVASASDRIDIVIKPD